MSRRRSSSVRWIAATACQPTNTDQCSFLVLDRFKIYLVIVSDMQEKVMSLNPKTDNAIGGIMQHRAYASSWESFTRV